MNKNFLKHPESTKIGKINLKLIKAIDFTSPRKMFVIFLSKKDGC